MLSAPLNGVVVVERAGRLAGAVAASLLANLGASVVRFGDTVGRPSSDPDDWHRHPIALEGKTVVQPAADYTKRTEQWQELTSKADVVFQSAPDDSSASGRPLGSAAGRAPLTCVFTALGIAESADGDNWDETQLQALTGVAAVTGEAGQPPQIITIPILEIFAGINGAASVIAALRAGAPHGTILDLAVYDSGVALLGTFHSSALEEPSRRFRDGCRHPLLAPWNTYRAKDGWIMLCSTTDEHWQRLLALMECAALRDDPRFAETNSRAKNAAAVDAIVGEWTSQRTMAEAIGAISTIGIPVGPVATIPQLVAQEKIAGRTRELAAGSEPARICPIPLFDIEPGAMSRPAPISRKSALPNELPCAGVRVIEIGPYTAGPFAGRLLADLGAEVIKIEPVGGEVSRKWLPSFSGTSGYFANYNAGKLSLALDFSSPQGAATLWQLMQDADVVIQNLSPGALRRAGFGHEAVLARFPELVYCSISGYGAESGPRPALDTVIQAASGIMTQVGKGRTSDKLPYLKVGISIADLLAAHIASLATLTSLGPGPGNSTIQGGHIDISMLRGLTWMTQLAWHEGDSHFPPAAVIPCKDGFVVAQTAQSPEYFLQILASRTKSREQISVALRACGIRSAPVVELHEALTSALTVKRNLVQWKDYRGQDIAILSSPHRWSAAAPQAGPCIGEAGADAGSILAMHKSKPRKG